MAEPAAAEGGDGELEDEMWGNLRLRRGGVQSGYYSALSLLRKWLLESAALDLAHFLKSHIDNHA